MQARLPDSYANSSTVSRLSVGPIIAATPEMQQRFPTAILAGAGLRKFFRRRAQAACLLTAVLFATAGCQSGTMYSAATLPPQFVAPRVGSAQNADLSQLARSVSNSDILYPGDVVEVSIATGLEEEQSPSWKLRVSETGGVNVPLVGVVQIAGMELTQAESAIRHESIRRGKFVAPNVSVILNQRRVHRITVLGAVDKPGTYELPANSCDMLSAIVEAGGLTEKADTRVEIRHPPGIDHQAIARQRNEGQPDQLAAYRDNQTVRTPPRTVQIDLEHTNNVPGQDLVLQDGATIMVKERPERFLHVIGLVKKADQFEIPDDQELHLLDAIALAGGRTLSIADKIQIIRKVPGQAEPVVIQASVIKAKRDSTSNIRLAAGDVVSVEETPTTFVVGTVRDFVRFGFSSALPGF